MSVHSGSTMPIGGRWSTLRKGLAAAFTVTLTGTMLTLGGSVTRASVQDSGIWVSVAADRSNPVPLINITLTGRVAIFVLPVTGGLSVSFYLDGEPTPRSVERFAPYDFAHTQSSGVAGLFDTSLLSAGAHRISAVRTFSNGTPPLSSTGSFALGAAGRVVTTCGTQLCMDSRPWRVNGGATNGNPRFGQTPDGNTALAVDLKVNTLRLTDFIPHPGVLGVDEYDAQRWVGVDGMVARAKQHNLKVELDLSTYRNFLRAQSTTFNPYTYDWTSFLTFVANRKNSITGERYGSDPTISFVAFAGETEAPDHQDAKIRGITAQQLITFYDKVMTTWGRLAPGQVRIPGGLYFLTDTSMPWRQIFALKSCDLPAVHSYSISDERSQVAVAAFASSVGKPWYLEEFGFAADNYASDSARARDFNRQEDLALGNHVAGVSFWNINPQALDILAAPLTAAAIRARNTGLAAG